MPACERLICEKIKGLQRAIGRSRRENEGIASLQRSLAGINTSLRRSVDLSSRFLNVSSQFINVSQRLVLVSRGVLAEMRIQNDIRLQSGIDSSDTSSSDEDVSSDEAVGDLHL